MITRVEIDGFKTFEDFAVDLNPFVVILGPNASGKSNFLDALRFIGLLAESDIRSAVTHAEMRGDPDELFRRNADGTISPRMRFAVEVLLDATVADPWQERVSLTHTRLRYELELVRRDDGRGRERILIDHEAVLPILSRDEAWQPSGHKPSVTFRQRYMHYQRKVPFLDMEKGAGRNTFKVHRDGGAGRERLYPAEVAEATVLSSITTANEFKHLYALRQELRGWRFLQLDANVLRSPSQVQAPDDLRADGSNLPTVLARLREETADVDHPWGVLVDIAGDLAQLIPEVTGVRVEGDQADRPKEWRIRLETRDGAEFSASVLSDGTVRLLALLTLLHDPRHRGVLCFEEPENGIHPLRLHTLMDLLHGLASDPLADDHGELPLSQIIMNSHSPVVLSILQRVPGSVMFADQVSLLVPGASRPSRRTRFRLVAHDEQLRLSNNMDGDLVASAEVHRYLATVGGGA